MMHNNPERPGVVELLAAHREQQKAVPAPRAGHIDLAQIRSRLAATAPAQVDHMVEEVEKLRFGQEAFDLAQEYLAAGKLDRARHWLAVAARHDIDQADGLLADVDAILEAFGSLELHQAPATTESAPPQQTDAADERERQTAAVDDVHDAAEALRQAHAHAQSIVRAAQQSADEILAEARRGTGSRDALADLWESAAARWKPAHAWHSNGDEIRCENLVWLLRAAGDASTSGHTRLWHPPVTPVTPTNYLNDTGVALLALAAAAVEHRPVSAVTAAARYLDAAIGIRLNVLDNNSSSAIASPEVARRPWLIAVPSYVDALRVRESLCSTVLDSAHRLWTPAGRAVSHSSIIGRQERERIVAGPRFRQAIDDLKEQMAPPESRLVPMASGRSA